MTAEREPTLRLFVAIEPTREWLDVLEKAQTELRSALDKLNGPKLRWVRPESTHLTLKFLGAVPESKLDSVKNALKSATNSVPNFTLAIGRVSFFGDRRGPRVVWVGLDGVTPEDRRRLYALVESIETWCAAAGFARDRRFAPHLTLARLPETLSREERSLIAGLVTAMPARRAAPMHVDRVHLIRSHIGPGGARYEELAAFPQ